MNKIVRWTIALTVISLTGWNPAAAQEAGPSTLPSTTNPFDRVVYPAGSQSESQQQTDQLECYRWSSSQMDGWDPLAAYDLLVQEGYVSAGQAAQQQGKGLRGAAGGALAGVAIGAIAGDAGSGAAIGAVSGGLIGHHRSRRARQDAQSDVQAALAVFQQDAQQWDRGWSACMGARDYSIS